MARARNLKPSFFSDAELVECEFWVRLLFAGLWTLADREGRLLDRPKQIKIDLFPADTVEIEAGLADLEAHGLIIRYAVDGQRLIQVKNFTRHQNPHRDERASTLPAAPSIEEHHAGTVQAPYEPGGNRADSLNLQPDSPNRTPDSLTDTPAALAKPTYSPLFEQFWREWSTGVTKGHGGKTPASAVWKRLNLDAAGAAATREELAAGLARWKASGYWQQEGGRFVMAAERWLKERKWGDDPPEVYAQPRASPANGKHNDPRAMFDLARRYEEQGL